MALDLEAYSSQRSMFLAKYLKFRHGEFDSGKGALDDLITMFHILPAARYFQLDSEAATAFLARIDKLSDEIYQFNCLDAKDRKGELMDYLKKFIVEFDAIIREFHKIMYICGYSK